MLPLFGIICRYPKRGRCFVSWSFGIEVTLFLLARQNMCEIHFFLVKKHTADQGLTSSITSALKHSFCLNTSSSFSRLFFVPSHTSFSHKPHRLPSLLGSLRLLYPCSIGRRPPLGSSMSGFMTELVDFDDICKINVSVFFIIHPPAEWTFKDYIKWAKNQQPLLPTTEEALWMYDENLIDKTTPGEIDSNNNSNNNSVHNLVPVKNEGPSCLTPVKEEHPYLTEDSLNTTTKGDSDMLLFWDAHMAKDDDLVSFHDEPPAPVIMHESSHNKDTASSEAYRALLAFEQDLLTIAVANHIDSRVSNMAASIYKTLLGYKFLECEYLCLFLVL